MNYNKVKKTNAFLQSGQHELQLVFAKIKELQRLNNIIIPHLDPAIQKYCVVANRIGSTVIIITANGSIATQLRFSVPDLLRKFKQDTQLQAIKEIQCKVRPSSTTTSSKPVSNKVEKLSPQTAEMMREMAESLEDKKLKEIMEKIAAHVKE